MDIIYCHNTMAQRGSLKQTKNSRHVEAKIDQKEKKTSKQKEKVWRTYLFSESVHKKLKMKGPQRKPCKPLHRCLGDSQSTIRITGRRKKWLRGMSGKEE